MQRVSGTPALRSEQSGQAFDGDTASGTYLMTDEALSENDRYLKTRRAWVSPDGSLRASANYDTVKLVVRNLTRR